MRGICSTAWRAASSWSLPEKTMAKKPTVTEATRALEQAARVATQGQTLEQAGQFIVPEVTEDEGASTGDELVLYEGNDGVKVELRYSGDTMWATQKQMTDI